MQRLSDVDLHNLPRYLIRLVMFGFSSTFIFPYVISVFTVLDFFSFSFKNCLSFRNAVIWPSRFTENPWPKNRTEILQGGLMKAFYRKIVKINK